MSSLSPVQDPLGKQASGHGPREHHRDARGEGAWHRAPSEAERAGSTRRRRHGGTAIVAVAHDILLGIVLIASDVPRTVQSFRELRDEYVNHLDAQQFSR